DAGAREEAHEAELHTVALLEALLVARAQLEHAAHVDLVEGREDRRGLLRLDEALGDALADAAHRDGALFLAVGPVVGGAGGLRGGGAGRGGARRRGRRR